MNEKDFTKHVILLKNIEGIKTSREQILAHVEFLRELKSQKKLIMCGPFDLNLGGMIILNVCDLNEAEAIAKSDPFVKERVRTFEVRTWFLSCEENNHLGVL